MFLIKHCEKYSQILKINGFNSIPKSSATSYMYRERYELKFSSLKMIQVKPLFKKNIQVLEIFVFKKIHLKFFNIFLLGNKNEL